ncbi:HDOD domain-containing protein [Neptuniibacter sp. QD37_11]|uniref:HDOD domain-containing protein n=1 Tax=Neptuniibacter sp. QD37_11 TaxID=3398209 RepID=UPI0039F44C35
MTICEGILDQEPQIVTLDDVKAHVEELPMLPGVLYHMLQADPEDDYFFEGIYDLASCDPPLASFILGYANSASSNPQTKIENLREALTRVGAGTVVELITAQSMTTVFVPTRSEHRALWLHSVEVATIAAFLCRVSKQLKTQPQLAYLTGLIHDIGRFVMMQLAPNALQGTKAGDWSCAKELVKVESSCMGFTHAQVGYLTCLKLGMSPMISAAVRYHHHKKVATHPRAKCELRELSMILQFADEVSVLLIRNPDWRTWSEDELNAKLVAYCTQKDWHSSSDIFFKFDMSQLVKALPILVDQSEELCFKLGVG